MCHNSGSVANQDAPQWEPAKEGRDIARQILRVAAVFAALVAALVFALWWAGSAVRFAAARVKSETRPTYRVFGVVRDRQTCNAIPWAVVEDESAGRAGLHRTHCDARGAYQLLTLAEPLTIWVSALGYQRRAVRIGRPWYAWLPWGSERVDVDLEREPAPPP